MELALPSDAEWAAQQFDAPGSLESVRPHGRGHIHDTYVAAYRQEARTFRCLIQRINTGVFKEPARLMENIQRVTEHIERKMSRTKRAGGRRQEALRLIPTRAGLPYALDGKGRYWRAFAFIEEAKTCDTVESPGQAYEAARAFGAFQASLSDFPPPRLHETIADFHNTPKRLSAFRQAVAEDPCNRAGRAKEEIEFLLRSSALAPVLVKQAAAGLLPERVTHNDTKINNVLLDEQTGEGCCVIDLDTVMPGLALYDFGDMVRTMTTTAAEDEQDLSKVALEPALFEAVARGYLETAGDILSPYEKDHLVLAGKSICFEQAIRFLTDYLLGDPYYKIRREYHNLDRCRTQIRLIESITEQEEHLGKLVERLSR